MEIYSHPDIPEILSLPGNSSCCDCGMEKPKWASLNNGAFLCLKCAGVHRSLGVDISTIRSLQIDSWTDKQILYLTNGGNNKLKQIWEEYGINQNSSLDLKYKSKACEYYRKYLKNIVEKISDKDYKQIELIKPSTEEGKELMEIKQGKDNVNNVNIIGDFNEPKKEEGFFGAVGSFFSSVKKTATEAANKLTKEIDELKIKDKLIEAGDKISDNAKIVGNFIKDKSQQALKSEFVQGITKKAESGINVVIEKTKVLLNKNENQSGNINVISLENNDNGKINNDNEPDVNQKENIQMSNVINDANINHINDINNDNKDQLKNEREVKNEQVKPEVINNDQNNKENISKEEKIEKLNLEDKNNVDISNNALGNAKLEEENVKFEPEKNNGF